MINEMRFTEKDQLDGNAAIGVKVNELFEIMRSLWGSGYIDSAIEKAGLSEQASSHCVESRIYVLQRLVLKDDVPIGDTNAVLDKVQRELARLVARQQIEDKLSDEVNKLLEEKHESLLDELKLSILRKKRGPENPYTLKKLVNLQRLDTIHLSCTLMERLRPSAMDEVVGQRNAVAAILAKLATPYPQHMILYGPPGVGKTTTARLALAMAKQMGTSCFGEDAAFIEVDGTTMRWDRSEATNPLIGSVHDPIYQGSRKDLAESGVPEPKPGLVSDAHGGVLFIDEIGELDPTLQNKLLKVLEDKRVEFSSSYYDPEDKSVPAYIHKLFADGAHADFILIGATTRQPHEINPALRSRCAEVYFEPLSRTNIQEIVKNAAARLQISMDSNVPEMISGYTMEGRKAVNILSDAFGNAIYRMGAEGKEIHITCSDVAKSAALARLTSLKARHAEHGTMVGRVNGLGVSGFIGSVMEIEAVAFRREDNCGTIRFNDTAGSMAKDSVFNAVSVIKSLEGVDAAGYDVHVNMVGGGNVDGPSAGCAITIAILSALTIRPVRQDVAITGEISLLGQIKPVGGVIEKIYGALQAGFKMVLIPWDNRDEVPDGVGGIEIVPVKHINEAINLVF